MEKSKKREEAIVLFWDTIPAVWNRTREVIRQTAAEKFHLTVEQFQVLRRIRRGIASVSAIAEDNRTSRSAVSKAVDALVNKGLVARSQDPNDRRNIPLALTEAGQQAMSTIFDEAEKWLYQKMETMNETEMAALCEGMTQLKKIARRDNN